MFEIDREKLGGFIAELRREKGITQKELAELLHISDKAVSKWETGHSIPDVNMLVPLADVLGISVTELLEGRRMETPETIDTKTADNLVKKVIELSEEQNPQKKKKHMQIYFILLAISVIEMLGIYMLGKLGILQNAEFITSIWTVVPIAIAVGAYSWIFMKEKLPSYYDENKISVYVDGFVRMNMVGVYFNNHNWGHILKAFRIWSVFGMVVYPGVHLLLVRFFEMGSVSQWYSMFFTLILPLGFTLGGMFVPVYVLGRKYEHGENVR